MGKVKAPHHKGTHQARAAKICAAAYANPDHRCWRCQRTLAQIRSLKPKARWTAGHLPGWDGIPDAPMAAECSPCNYAAGARLRHAKVRRQQTARATDLTWRLF